MNHKCSECGNTFTFDNSKFDDIISCPICEANYKIVVKDGKPKLTEYVYDTEDPGEL